ncbi:MAG: undecaprenyl-diphosphate phosphatase [Opitutales bacterium]|nr:undecaprenyl-diphosphate phosphatase [Opitutales bacterium]
MKRWVYFFAFLGTQLFAQAQKETPSFTKEKISTAQAITLGVVQGITEFLPISSTGHMIIANECIFHTHEKSMDVQNGMKAYIICINVGTIFMLLLFFRNHLQRILKGFCGHDSGGFQLGMNLCFAFIPAGLLGFFTEKALDAFYTRACVALGLIVGGFFIFWIERVREKSVGRYANIYELPFASAWVIGGFQCIALWPGFSRSLSTIIGGILVGFTLVQAIQFSFLLGLLTDSLATVYKFFKHGEELRQTIDGSTAWLGIVVAFLVGVSTIHGLFQFLQKNGLRVFGYYRILVGFLLLLL